MEPEGLAEPTRILKLREKPNRAELQLSGREEWLRVSLDLVYEFRLKEGIVLTPPQVAKLEQAAERFRCEYDINRLMALRDHSAGEIRYKLQRRKYSPEVIAETMAKFERLGIINDEQYAFNAAVRAIERTPSGRSFLVGYLLHHRVPREIAEQAADLALQQHDEVSLAVKALHKKLRTYKDLPIETARKKAYTYLGGRGISYSAAKTAFEQVFVLRNEE